MSFGKQYQFINKRQEFCLTIMNIRDVTPIFAAFFFIITWNKSSDLNNFPSYHSDSTATLLIVIVILLDVHSGVSELIVNSPASIAGNYTAYPIIYRNNFRNETIDGEIVLANSTDVKDKIVLVVYYRATYLTQIRNQQGRGARAIIISAQPGGKTRSIRFTYFL